MERKEFLSLLGSSAAALFAVGCLGGCSGSDSDDPQPSGPGTGSGGSGGKKDFTLNLATPANASLKTPGNALISNGVIVAFTTASSYVAVSSTCTHEGNTIGYDAGNKKFSCPAHGSAFNENGTVLNGPASTALKQYKTTLTGDNLRVYED
ncbi:QcrA and Rieske domain-containing protein [Adhaeribacter rhizoryzae]|uniref:Rieske (2Fe-2S) protein n=1 Tax=Adhaeribacter rhizoryzae TaxID=2607907 RepID=A0A5M6DNF4_9BACT|nr:Rieske (2Fe-2S) protein [Adhaeribacter rhizoryzae]KAA5547789.1 Rieske (2Fe-2S) protein [Adhaeribacter rhizoryzae]